MLGRSFLPTVSLVLAIGFVAAPPGVLRGQDTSALAPGTRVRVKTPVCTNSRTSSCSWIVGTLASIDSATIELHDENGMVVAVPRTRSTQLDVSTGRGKCSADRGRCVAIGLFVGAAVGVVAGFVIVETQGGPSSVQCIDDSPICPTYYYVATMAGGAIVGTVVGAVVGRERWRHVEATIRVGMRAAGNRGLAFGLSVPF